jgi:hypothetical protein
MQANEMRARFLLQYEGAKLGNRTFNDREIADFLNKAQIQLVKTRFDALKNRTQRGFGDTAIRQAELDGLLSATVTLPNSTFIQGTKYNGALRNTNRNAGYVDPKKAPAYYGVFCQLPDEVLYVVNESVTTADNINIATATVVKDNIPVEEINYLEYKSRIYDPYAQPYDNLVWSMGYGNWMTATYNVNTGGTFDTPNLVSVNESTKHFTMNTGTTPYKHNIWGIRATTWDANNSTGDPSVEVATEIAEWIAFDSRRSRYLISAGHSIHTDVSLWQVVEYQCHYIKEPPSIFIDVVTPTRQINCVLADFLHQEIVDLSVKLAAAAIIPEQNKYQVNDNETKINE